MVFNLIMKDVIFNLKNVLIGVLFWLITIVYIITTNIDQVSFYSLLSISFINSFIFTIGFGCYKDDNSDTLRYLKSLPIKLRDIVLAKYIQSLAITIIPFIAIMILCNTFKLYYLINLNLIMFIVSNLLIFVSVFLYIFFRYSYHFTRYTGIIVVPLIILIIKFQTHINMLFEKSLNPLYVFIAISGLLLLISYKLSVSAVRLRE